MTPSSPAPDAPRPPVPSPVRRRWPYVVAAAIVFGMLAAVAIMNERRHEIDLTKERRPFNMMRLPLRYVGAYAKGERSSSGLPFPLVQLRLVDADKRIYTFQFRKDADATNLDGATGNYLVDPHEWQPLEHPARAWELCLHLLEGSSDPPPSEYYKLSGEEPAKPSRFRKMIHSIFK